MNIILPDNIEVWDESRNAVNIFLSSSVPGLFNDMHISKIQNKTLKCKKITISINKFAWNVM